MKTLRYWYLPLFALALLLLVTPAVADNKPNPGVFPPNSHPYGETYGEWNARWWQWVFSVPASKNPALAENGAIDCSEGQKGDVWFLAGSFESGSNFTRSCAVPTEKALFIPLINSWSDNVCVTPPYSVGKLHAFAADLVKPPQDLHASIDGKPLTDLKSYRAVSPVFSYTLPPSPDNLIYKVYKVFLPGDCWPSLTVTPAVADGYYIMLAPLSKGTHTINFGGTGPWGFTLDMTYELTVGD